MSGRVVQLIDTGGPGGAEMIFSTLARGLSDVGWKAVPVVPEDGWLWGRLEADGLDPVLVTNRRSYDVRYLVRLVKLIRRSRANLVHTHLLASSVYGCAAGAVCGIPVVCTFHGMVDLDEPGVLERVKLWWLNRAADRVVFVSEDLRRRLADRMGLDQGKTCVIPNGVDTSRFSGSGEGRFRRELGVGPDEVLVGAVGNVRPAKDYGLFLEAAARLRARDARYRFVVVGEHDNALYDQLREEQERLGLDGIVTFTGLREDVPAVLTGLDVFVLTSSSEGFSLSTVEAMAAGRPVVATRCGGPEEILTDGVDGRLVESGCPEALADAIEGIVADSDGSRRMAERGRRMVEREYSIDRMVDRYESLYEECLGRTE